MNNISNAINGAKVVVRFSDGRPDEEIAIQELKLRQMKAYGLLVGSGDEAGQVALFVGKDEQWVDALTNESAVEVLEAGQSLNQESLIRWLERATKLAQQLEQRAPKTAAQARTAGAVG